jgi:very-short-patch-repair endonuclease
MNNEERRDPSATFSGSSPARGAFNVKARSAEGVSMRRCGPFLFEDLVKRGLVWDGLCLPYNPKLIDAARNLRLNMTTAEKKLWYDFLRGHERKFYRQRPIDHFIADFYCSDVGLVIEIDGSQHYTETGLVRDKVRSDILEIYGIQIQRFTNNEVTGNFAAVCETIDRRIEETPQPPSVAEGAPSLKKPRGGGAQRRRGLIITKGEHYGKNQQRVACKE